MNDWSEPFNQKEFEKVLKPFIVDNDELNKILNDKSIIYISSAKVRKENNNDI